ncbi:MAG: glycosyltransferase [Desulfonatronovibrionaceae bacterium]
MHTDNNRPIAFFIPALNGGGAQKVVVNLVNALPELTDHPLHVVLARKEGEFLDELRTEVQVIDLGTNRASRSVWALVKYMRRYKPQVLMSSMSYVNIICMLAVLLAGRPCRTILREANVVLPQSGSLFMRLQKKWLIYLMRIIYPLADVVIANSQETLNSMEQAGIRVRNKAAVFSNPITIPPLDSEPISLEWLPEPRPPYICSVGRLATQKGFDILLSAFARLEDTKIHLVILGEGELRESLTRQAEGLGIKDRVHMPGFVQNPMAVVRQSKVFVLSTRWEGFGNVLVEALATGVPVVSTDCPGAPGDILENGVHGYLVPYDDPGALANGIVRALITPAGTPEGRKARAEDFSAEKIARKYLEEALLPDEQD